MNGDQMIATQLAMAERQAQAQKMQAYIQAIQPIHPCVVAELGILNAGIGFRAHLAIEMFKSLLAVVDLDDLLEAKAENRQRFLNNLAAVAMEACTAIVGAINGPDAAAAEPEAGPKLVTD